MTWECSTIDRGTEDKLCLECDAQRTGSVTEVLDPEGGRLVVSWECQTCGWQDDIGVVPDDRDHLEELKQQELAGDPRRERR